MNLFDYPPATHKYRATAEELEELRRGIEIQRERQERYRRKLIEEGKIRPDPLKDKEPT